MFSLPVDDGEGSMDEHERQSSAFQRQAAVGSSGGNQGAAAALRARLNGTTAEATEGVVSQHDSWYIVYNCFKYDNMTWVLSCLADAVWQMALSKVSLSGRSYAIAIVMELLSTEIVRRGPILEEIGCQTMQSQAFWSENKMQRWRHTLSQSIFRNALVHNDFFAFLNQPNRHPS